MNKRKTGVLSGLLLLGLGVIFFHSRLCTQASASCGTNTGETSSTSKSDPYQLAPRYFIYSPQALLAAQQHGFKAVLYFWAPWCSSCTALDIDIHKDPSLIPEDVIVLRIDYDHSPDLKSLYHVTTQHTFVQIDQNGKAIQQWVGGNSSDLKDKVR